MKLRGMDCMFENGRGTGFVFYNQFDMGNKFKVYSKHGGAFQYQTSFGTCSEAIEYAKKIH